MSRRDNREFRCDDCLLHRCLCICGQVPRLETQSRLCLVIHRDEVRKPTNTGRLATRCLAESELLVHGRLGEPVTEPQAGFTNLLLFPCDEAEELCASHLASGPVRLVVPDGTWRQASKMVKRIPWLAKLPRVGLPPGAESMYRLRAEPKAGGLGTMEAISRAFGVLEGAAVQAELDGIFRKMTDRTLYSRGRLAREDVFGGIPDEVQRHDPMSGTT